MFAWFSLKYFYLIFPHLSPPRLSRHSSFVLMRRWPLLSTRYLYCLMSILTHSGSSSPLFLFKFSNESFYFHSFAWECVIFEIVYEHQTPVFTDVLFSSICMRMSYIWNCVRTLNTRFYGCFIVIHLHENALYLKCCANIKHPLLWIFIFIHLHENALYLKLCTNIKHPLLWMLDSLTHCLCLCVANRKRLLKASLKITA